MPPPWRQPLIDPNTRLAFSVVENPGVYALLLGSGISRAAEIPTGWDITLDLVRRVAAAEGVTDVSDWAAWHIEKFGGEPGYSSLLDALSVTPTERRSILHHYIEPSQDDLDAGRRIPTLAHHAIARMVQSGFIKVVVTTNFDRLMETALSMVGVEPIVIKSVDDLAGASPLPHSRCYLLKIHGDYLDNRILNTEDELAAYPGEYNALLDRILDEYGLIVSGWSGDWDPALRSALTRAPNRRYPTWWASRGEPSTAADDLISARAATVIPVTDADSFFVQLADGVEVLEKARRPAPETIEMLIAATKRNLASPERRIELGDMIANEAERVIRRIKSEEFPVQHPSVTNDVLIERWQALEAVAEPLARMGGIAGRWGDGSEFDHMRSAVKAIVGSQPDNGNQALIGVANYPAYLLYHTYALGMTKAERWKDLFRWFTMPLTRRHRQTSLAINSIFLSYWDGVELDWWKRWPGLDRRKTAWADHMIDAIVPWSRDFGLIGGEAVDNFHTLEVLGGFANLTGSDAEYLSKLNDPIWMPCGQTGWNVDARAAIVERLQAPDVQPQILAVGFCRGSAEHWAGCLNAFDQLSRRMGWW